MLPSLCAYKVADQISDLVVVTDRAERQQEASVVLGCSSLDFGIEEDKKIIFYSLSQKAKIRHLLHA